MLDIKFIRENLELVKAGAKKKHVEVDFDKLVFLDDQRKEIQKNLDNLKSEQNIFSEKISQAETEERENLIKEVSEIKEKIKSLEEKEKPILEEWKKIMLQIPNVPDPTVPEGKSDQENLEIKTWGEKKDFSFSLKSHIEIMENLDMVDFKRGSKVHGFRGYYLKNDGARLCWAIWNYANDFFLKKGFEPMITPTIVREENLYGTGHLPNEAEDTYKTQDNDYLAGTSEVAVMAYYRDEIINLENGEKKFLAFSPCYRREAGSYGKDTKGLIRVHEFFKLEQIVLCEASHEKTVQIHEQINRNTEEFIESLEIPYRTVLNCGGDLGLGQVKKYDIELWVPAENKYREISSASYFHDFQTRRFNIKYKNEDGKNNFAHSLNCTAIPTPRILVSLIENFQTEDGKIIIPKVLQKYLNEKNIIE